MISPQSKKLGPNNKVLIVEGPDDMHMLYNLLDYHRIHYGLQIDVAEGYDNARESLGIYIKNDDQTHIGIIVDADTNFDSRWQSIRDVIIRAGYQDVPRNPNLNGTIIEQRGKPKLGIWIMPDNQSHGMMEDFAQQLLPPQDRLWDRAVSTVATIPSEDRLFLDIHESKACIHTWLAWQNDPGKPIGQAIKIGYLEGKSDVGQKLVNWLRTLFEL